MLVGGRYQLQRCRAIARLRLDADLGMSEDAISRRSVQALIFEGRLPSVKIGRARRVARVDLETFVQRLRENE